MKNQKRTGEIKTRADGTAVEGYDKDTGTLTLSFASDTPYRSEVLTIKDEAVDLTRLNGGLGAVLFNHNRDDIIGHVNRAWIDGNKARAEITLDDDERGQWVRSKLEAGSLNGVSVGYRVNNYVYVPEGSELEGHKGECWIATKWEALEISLVSVPADATVGVGRSVDEPTAPEIIQDERKEQPMEEKQVPEMPDVKKEREDAAEKARAAERQRVTEVTAVCRQFEVDPAEYIERGATVDEVRAAVLDELAKARQAVTATTEVVEDETDKMRAAYTDGILLRGGIIDVTKAAPGADELRAISLRTVFEDVLAREGVTGARRMSEDDLIRAALTSTSSLPGILSNAAKKSMLKGYDEAATTFEKITSVGTAVDFKKSNVYELSAVDGLELVKENGEFKQGEVKDTGRTKNILTYGKKFSLSRQMIVNDDMGVLTRLPRLYAQAARRGINTLVYKTLTDKKYYENDVNTVASGGALTLEAIDAARVAMAKRKDISGKAVLNIVPRYLVVPMALEFKARQLMASVADPAGAHAGVINPLRGALEVIADPTLDAIDAKAWYLVADPKQYDGIEVAYLNGNQAPHLDPEPAFDRLGIDYRIYIDYGVTVLSDKALYKNPGK